MKKFFKNFAEMLKNDKKKLIILVGVVILLIIAITTAIVKNNTKTNSLKDEDIVMESLLEIFYEEKDSNNLAKVVLGDTTVKYFGSIEQDLYTQVYSEIRGLGEADLINGMSAVEISNNYSNQSMKVLTKVKDAKIKNKEEINNGYRFTIEVTKGDVADAYKKANECAAVLIPKIQKEDPALAELVGYQNAAYYYCLAEEGYKKMSNNTGEKSTIEVELIKNEDNQYIPTKDSLKALLGAAY